MSLYERRETVRNRYGRWRNAFLLLVFTASAFSASQAATLLSNASGLTVDPIPSSISGTSFTDAMGNVVTAGQSFFVNGGVWYGAGDLTVTFVSPETSVGFTFENICGCINADIPNFTLFDSITLGNGDGYNMPSGIAGGSAEPLTQFLGVSSATPFLSATFHEHPYSSFGISDFRFGSTNAVAAAPEPATVGFIAPAVLAIFGALRRRYRRKQ